METVDSYKVGHYYYDIIRGKKHDIFPHRAIWSTEMNRWLYFNKNGKQIPWKRVHPSAFE